MASQPPTSTAPLTAYPTTPYYADDLDWITAYLDIHVLSDASMVYAYILWIALAVIVCVLAASHLARLRIGYLAAYWTKWAVRRRTWRKKHTLRLARRNGDSHKQPLSLPSNAQILTLTFLVLATLALAFVGPDYFAPGAMLWNVHDTPTASLSHRALSTAALNQYIPDYTIKKAWWTSGNRTGLIAFALFPLCVILALKAAPFAVLSLPFVAQLHFDKLAWLHKWIGRLIWLLSTLHVALWSVQLLVERRASTGKVVYRYAWDYRNFIYGWIAFGVMTLLILLSFQPIRQHHYELFYGLHVLLVPLTLIFSALHHPPVWWWCWGALAVWVGERLWRLTWWLHTNGYFGGMLPPPAPRKLHKASMDAASAGRSETWELDHLRSPTSPPTVDKYSSPSVPKFVVDVNVARTSTKVAYGTSGFYLPPPGFAHAELLPGRTVRLRLITPGYVPWAPGQHFLLRIPVISALTTHPFTCATVCDQEAPTDEGRELVFLIRAKNGWTKRLWDVLARLAAQGQSHVPGEAVPAHWDMPRRGMLVRTFIDGPFGSAARARWGAYSTVVIIAGGSGVSFGLSVLQFMCLCLAGRDGRYLGGKSGGWGQPGFNARRVRFVWLVREYSHIQWCATLLRRCMAMVPAPELQVDIFVTNVKPSPQPERVGNRQPDEDDDGLIPPSPRFAREGHRGSPQDRGRPPSVTSLDSEMDSFVDLSYYTGDFVEDKGELGHEEHVLDLTNFEGDDDTALPGESQFNLSVKKEGKLRRAASQALLSSKRRSARRNEKLPPPITPAPRTGDQRPDTDTLSIEERQRNHTPEQDIGTFVSTNSVASSSTLLSPDTIIPPSHFRDTPALGAAQINTSGLSTAAMMTRPLSTNSQMSSWSDVGSLAALVSDVDIGKTGDHLRLELDEHELQDVGIVAEHARPGKPKLERILEDEVRQAQGPIVVGCCGPLSLNAMVRKTIAAQINPGRIRRGDLSGSITLISEDFGY